MIMKVILTNVSCKKGAATRERGKERQGRKRDRDEGRSAKGDRQ